MVAGYSGEKRCGAGAMGPGSELIACSLSQGLTPLKIEIKSVNFSHD